MHEWIQRLEPFIRFARENAQIPLTFLVGAGASISSGAPCTDEVIQSLRAYDHHAPAEELRSQVHTLPEQVKNSAILSLFPNHITPYLGYRAMAAIAHRRRVLVLNLNWDDAVEVACEAVGVHYVSVDATHAEDIRAALADPEAQLICVHLHGRLADGDIRFGSLETVHFPEEIEQLLLEQFLRYPTVLVGATMRGGNDMPTLLKRMEKDNEAHSASPIWLLTRDQSVLDDGSINKLLSSRNSERFTIFDPSLDFDRALVWINAELSGSSFDNFRAANAKFVIPPYNDIVWPNPAVFRPHLDKKTVVLLGEARLGKSTLSHFLAFFFNSLRPPVTDIHEAPELKQPQIVIGPTRCASMLANERPQDVVVLGDPFGSTNRFESNPSFMGFLRSGGRKTERHGRTLVTTRRSVWREGTKETTQETDQQMLFRNLPDEISIVDDDEPWYLLPDLEISLPPTHPHLKERIVPNDLNTPARVQDAVRGHGSQTEDVDEKVKIFRAMNLVTLRLVGLLRLQLLSSNSRVLERLLREAGLDNDSGVPRELAPFTHKYELEKISYARLRHQTDVEAADRLLVDSESPLRTIMGEVGERVTWVRDALRVHAILKEIEHETYESALAAATSPQLAEWAPTFLAVAGKAEILPYLDRGMDLWSLREYVFELVRLWADLSHSPIARNYLAELLGDRKRQGVYAVLEAALFLRGLTNPEIWVGIEHELFRLYHTPEENRKDLALAFDALLWSDAPDVRIHPEEWIERLLARTAPRSDPLSGALAFSLVYHANHARAYLEKATYKTLDLLRDLTDDQAEMFCWMLRWHFLHECRDRALIQRHQLPAEFLPYLRRTMVDQPATPDDRALLAAACEQLHKLKYSGAAILLAMNVSAIRGRFNMDATLKGLIANTEPGDVYALLAFMTFEVSGELLNDVRAFFRDERSRTALLDAFAYGVPVDEVRLERPRFDACRDPFVAMDFFELTWPDLERVGVPLTDRMTFMAWMKAWRYRVNVDPAEVRRLQKRLERGDLRLLQDAARDVRARETPEASQKAIIERAVELFLQQTTPLSFPEAQRSWIDVPVFRNQLRSAIESGNRREVLNVVDAILDVPPSEDFEQRRLRLDALRTRADYLLDSEPVRAQESMRELRDALAVDGRPLTAADERRYKEALVRSEFPDAKREERDRLLADSLEVLEEAVVARRAPIESPAYPGVLAAQDDPQLEIKRARETARDAVKRGKPRRLTIRDRLRTLAPHATTKSSMIEQIAQMNLVGVRTPPTKLEDLYTRLNVLAVQPVVDTIHAGEVRREGDGYRIVHSAFSGDYRTRFTIAHELSHIIIDRAAPGQPPKGNELENVCNALAAALLMPGAEFRRVIGRVPSVRSLKESARLFAVSPHAAAVRCEELTRCVSCCVKNDGTVEWKTQHISPLSPTLQALIRDIKNGEYQNEPQFMDSKHHSGYWSVDFSLDETACTLLLVPVTHRG